VTYENRHLHPFAARFLVRLAWLNTTANLLTLRPARVALSVVLVTFITAGIGLRAAEKPTDVAGIWKLCYEPDLHDLYEPSDGYLALLPDGQFYEVRTDCCGEPDFDDPASQRIGLYTIDPESSRLHLDDGRSFVLRSDVTAVLFDALDSPVSGLMALQLGDSLNYAYCRVYP